ncbi:MAG TPA: TetR/AcrR family transcriptional regulator [Baekduia sp.]|nr:TetR/AcrR family transcriptional regulator [Baekduia sp.]
MRTKILAAALKIADEEGFAAVSMRRVAGELGVGTMSLYHYVAGKDELVFLASDELWQEILLDEVPGDWRDALTAIAERSRELLMKRPWLLRQPADDNWRVGPNFVRHFDQVLQAVEPLAVAPATATKIYQAVEALVTGNVLRELYTETDEGAEQDVIAVFTARTAEIAADLELPRVQAAMQVELPFQSGFEEALTWLLDGIAAEYEPGD